MTRRYLRVRIFSSEPVTGEQFLGTLTASLQRYFGEVGLSDVNPRMIRFDTQTSEAIVACQKGREDQLQAALALINHVGRVEVAPLTVRISGTIKGLRRRSR
jgi:RNase P/RNase MRP subunit POP5